MPQQIVIEGNEQLVLQGQVAREGGKGDPYISPRTRDCLESMSTVLRRNQGESSLLQDTQHNVSLLSVEGGRYPLQETEWSCNKYLAQFPKGKSESLSRVSLGRNSKCQIR